MCFLAEVPELPSLITDGVTRAEALGNAEAMIDEYVATARKEGWPLPQPNGPNGVCVKTLFNEKP